MLIAIAASGIAILVYGFFLYCIVRDYKQKKKLLEETKEETQ
jgi:hypothetical protein